MDGRKCKLYVNTGSRGSPTWTEAKSFRDLKRIDNRKKGESSSRESDFESVTLGQRTFGVSGDLLYKPADAAWLALWTAYEAGTIIDVFRCDAPGGPAATGKRFDAYVTEFGGDEPLNDKVVNQIAIENTFDGGYNPVNYTYPGS